MAKLLLNILIFISTFFLSGCYQNPESAEVGIAWYQMDNANHHIVTTGDSIYSVAFRYEIDFQDLAEINNIHSPYKLKAGQVLKLQSTGTTQKTQRKQSKVKSKITKWIWPTKGNLVQKFSTAKRQLGINISGKMHQPILAAASGEVAYAGTGIRGYGKLLIIKHSDDFFSAYAHNSKLLVEEGKIVTVGDKIALLGADEAISPMLHFEIRAQGKPVNPLKYLPKIN